MDDRGGLTFGDELASTVVSGQDDLTTTRPKPSKIPPATTGFYPPAPHPLMADSTASFQSATTSTASFQSATNGTASFYSATNTSSYHSAGNNTSSFYSTTSSAQDPSRASAILEPLRSSTTSSYTASAYDSVNLAASIPSAPQLPAPPADTDDSMLLVQQQALPGTGPAFSAELKVCIHSARKTWGPTALPGVDEFYMSYIVSTVTTLPSYAAKELNVKRRFRDVVDLSNLLWMVYPGSFIPARPKRNVVEGRRMTPAFVQARQASMERFLNRLAAHPVIGRSEELKTFLEIDGELRSSPQWQALHPPTPSAAGSGLRFIKQIVGLQRTTPTPAEVTRSTAASKDVFRMLHERLAAMTGRLPHEDLPQQEAMLQEQTQMYEELRKELGAAAGRAEEAMARMRECGEAVGDFGVVLVGLTKFEEQNNSAAARPCSIAGQSCLKAYKASRAAAEGCRQLLMPLQDYNEAMPCIHHALSQRGAALTTALTLRADLGATQQQLEGVRGQPQPNPRRVEGLRRAEELQDASSRAAMSEYHRIAARNLEDSRSFQANCEVEFHAMLKEFASAQQQHWTQQQAVWTDMARTMGADPRTLPGW